MATADETAGPDAEEEEQRERYRELLDELRTIIPGVQVLLAFLLTVPFSSRFTELDSTGTALFVVALATSALSVVVFLVPAAYHRLTSHARRSERIQVGIRMTLLGMVMLGVSIVTALLVVVRLIYGNLAAGLVAGGVLVALLALWFAFPFARERSHES